MAESRWTKAHAEHRGKEMADQQARVAARNKNIVECYIKIPKILVTSKQKEQSVKFWQSEWTEKTKGAITKELFPKEWISYNLE